MRVSIEVVEPKLFAGAVADEIVALLSEAIAERGTASIALSGGSTPSVIYRTLALPPRSTEVDWSKVKLFLGDERFVPAEDNQSNFKMVSETLLKELSNKKPQFFAVDTSTNPEDAAQRYEGTIRTALDTEPNAIPVFDVMLLGLGDDGHTASLFPRSPFIAEKAKMVVAVKKPEDGQSRITLTPPAIFSARRILFLVKGEEKSAMLKRVLEGSDDVATIPARLFVDAAERVTWYVDGAAASKLSGTKSRD